MTTELIFSFVLGTVIGSFLNVVIFRFNTGKTIFGRSACFSCKKTLAWYELFPIISYLAQRGRCRSCFSKFSSQYALVEFITGITFALLFWKLNEMIFSGGAEVLVSLCYFVVFSLLVVILVYDIKHKIIPNFFVYIAIALSFIALLLVGNIVDGIVAAGIFFLFFSSFWFFSKGMWMGLGDAKLAVVIGLLLGFWNGLFALFLSFWIGAIVGIGLLFLNKGSFTMKTEVPFAPFLICGLYLVFFFPFINFLNF